ncbi:hypothetical protein VP1G_11068 [Cytospora mali]|uniref:Aflatoxin regulatory protein domain-containing protein n=1 Tax=Cytospora mali TaxID=578113 RepID=A0A194V641_CYTMA|nr:hypothetical protein VP1G_11068 [Valsa mali var. pyri (nom. inval.)]
MDTISCLSRSYDLCGMYSCDTSQTHQQQSQLCITSQIRDQSCDLSGLGDNSEPGAWTPDVSPTTTSILSQSLGSGPGGTLGIDANSHSCLIQAVQLLVDITYDMTLMPFASLDFTENSELALRNITFANQRALNIVTGILDCQCTLNDFQIYIVVSLVGLRVLDRNSEAVVAFLFVRSPYNDGGVMTFAQVLLGQLQCWLAFFDRLKALGSGSRVSTTATMANIPLSVLNQLHAHLTTRARYVIQKAELLSQGTPMQP